VRELVLLPSPLNQVLNCLCLRIAGCMPMWASACLAAAMILLAVVPDAEARFRKQSPIDWRTFEVPDFGTAIQ
jgi:hypothetical protein